MSSKTRTAFPMKSGSKSAVESNLDKIINQSKLKVKEFMLKKQDLDKNITLLIGQEQTITNDINHIQSQINEKKSSIEAKKKEFEEIQNDIHNLQEEKKNLIKLQNEQEAKFKEGTNYINSQLETIANGNIPELAQKRHEIKIQCDLVSKLKDENLMLYERLQVLTRRLEELERENKFNENDDKTNKIKAENAIYSINEMFNFHEKLEKQKNEDKTEKINEEEENDGNGNDDDGDEKEDEVQTGVQPHEQQ
jgi:chromosome segregation ATPase